MTRKSDRRPGVKTVKTTIVIDEKLWVALRDQSTRERRPGQDIIADALNVYLKRRGAAK
jgi:hypothetical protein